MERIALQFIMNTSYRAIVTNIQIFQTQPTIFQ